MEQKENYNIDKNGFYGEFGGAFVPEMLHHNIHHLTNNYRKIIDCDNFQKEFTQLLHDFVGRPSPLYYASRLSAVYGINLFLKREDLNHTGSHKINNTIGQILLARYLGKKRIIAETGAGQHGVATATVCARQGLDCIIYMGATDVARQQPNVEKMQMLGAKVIPVYSGNKTLKDATNEAIRDWINHPVDTHYIIGSVVGPHPYPDIVAQFQSVIGCEIKKQLITKTGKNLPDSIIACVGGGSNAIGAFYPYLYNKNVRLVGVEADGEDGIDANTAATIATGSVGILHGSKTMLMQTLDGQVIEPYSISAGLDYPGIGPVHAHLNKTGRAKFCKVTDREAIDAALRLTSHEGIIPALESAHALAALEKTDFRKNENVVLNLSGRGDKDMSTYRKFL